MIVSGQVSDQTGQCDNARRMSRHSDMLTWVGRGQIRVIIVYDKLDHCVYFDINLLLFTVQCLGAILLCHFSIVIDGNN